MDDSRIEALRAAIVAQADAAGPDGWMELRIDPRVRASGRLRVPRGAFEQWAVRTTGGGHLAAPWKRVSPQGVKQGADDPFHTDWMLGADLGAMDMRHGSPDRALTDALNEAAYRAKAEVERRLLGFACSVLLSGPDVRGRVWHPRDPSDTRMPGLGEPPVAVIRDARPDWLDVVGRVLSHGGAVVFERGGEMAHLVSVMREGGKGPLVRVPGALKLYPEGLVLDVSAGTGRIDVRDDGRLPEPTGEVWVEAEALVPTAAPSRAKPTAAAVNLVPCGKDNPADRQSYLCLDKGYKEKGPRHEALAIVTTGQSEQASHPSWDRANFHLVIRVYEKGQGRPVANYYAGTGLWDFAEVKAATRQALDLHDPPVDPNIRLGRERAERQAREDAYASRLAAMPDNELVAYANGKVHERRRFLAEVEAGKWDRRDRVDITWDFSEAFLGIDAELERRGLERGVVESEAEDVPALPSP